MLGFIRWKEKIIKKIFKVTSDRREMWRSRKNNKNVQKARIEQIL